MALKSIEWFVIMLYDIGSTEESLTDARIDMFTRKGKIMLNIPFTSAACLQYIRRAVFQAGHVWGQTLIEQPEIKYLSYWGCQQDHDQKYGMPYHRHCHKPPLHILNSQHVVARPVAK